MTDRALNSPQLAELIRWAKAVRESQCKSFVDIALRHPAVWATLRHDGFLRRMLAQSMGWPLRLDEESIRSLHASEIGVVLLNSGLDSAADFWVGLPSMCNRLHRARKLDAALAFVRSTLEQGPNDGARDMNDVEPNPYGHMQAWLRLDSKGAEVAREQNHLDEALLVLPIMPPQGWPTAGGPVTELCDLIVARLLECAEIKFEAPGSTEIFTERDRHFDSFRLFGRRERIHVRCVADITAHEASGAMPCTVLIDRGLIDSDARIFGFAHHVIESLLDVGVKMSFDKFFSYSSLVQPDPPRL